MVVIDPADVRSTTPGPDEHGASDFLGGHGRVFLCNPNGHLLGLA